MFRRVSAEHSVACIPGGISHASAFVGAGKAARRMGRTDNMVAPPLENALARQNPPATLARFKPPYCIVKPEETWNEYKRRARDGSEPNEKVREEVSPFPLHLCSLSLSLTCSSHSFQFSPIKDGS